MKNAILFLILLSATAAAENKPFRAEFAALVATYTAAKEKVATAEIARLDTEYRTALEAAASSATGRDVTEIRGELQRLADAAPLPANDLGLGTMLTGLRSIYRKQLRPIQEAHAKILAPDKAALIGRLQKLATSTKLAKDDMELLGDIQEEIRLAEDPAYPNQSLCTLAKVSIKGLGKVFVSMIMISDERAELVAKHHGLVPFNPTRAEEVFTLAQYALSQECDDLLPVTTSGFRHFRMPLQIMDDQLATVNATKLQGSKVELGDLIKHIHNGMPKFPVSTFSLQVTPSRSSYFLQPNWGGPLHRFFVTPKLSAMDRPN
jgi:hypothetical protein